MILHNDSDGSEKTLVVQEEVVVSAKSDDSVSSKGKGVPIASMNEPGSLGRCLFVSQLSRPKISTRRNGA